MRDRDVNRLIVVTIFIAIAIFIGLEIGSGRVL